MKTTRIVKGKDGRPAFKWTVEFTVSRTWVEDGFSLDDERAMDMLSKDLGYAHEDELGAKVLSAPPARLVRIAQGFKR